MNRNKTLGASREKTLGVLGGGQLGRMFVQAAQRLGFETVVLDLDAAGPAAQVSNHHIAADHNNLEALQALADRCCAVTTEFENVPHESLAYLASRTRVSPPADAVRIAQDRISEKAHFAACGVPTAPYHVLQTQAQLADVPTDFYPSILKTARMGYDGKGQITVRSFSELVNAWASLRHLPCVLEQRMALHQECSVLLARSLEGTCIHWPVQNNVHINGILATTSVSMGMASDKDAQVYALRALHTALLQAATDIAAGLNYVGVLCIEFFILNDGTWVVNEIAPRPHNSGHVTMDASSLSQFEAQVRVAAGLPLVAPHQHSCCVMVNLLGDVWFESPHSESPREPDWGNILAHGSSDVGVHLHLYSKSEARRGRKMGHINVTASTCEAAIQVASLLQKELGSDPN